MRAFLLGLIGAFVGLIIAAQVSPMYPEYSERLTSEEIIAATKPIRAAIEQQLLKGPNPPSIKQAVGATLASKNVRKISIYEGRVILVQGGEKGQILVFTPVVENNKVSWSCMGGPYMFVPAQCRNPLKNDTIFSSQNPTSAGRS